MSTYMRKQRGTHEERTSQSMDTARVYVQLLSNKTCRPLTAPYKASSLSVSGDTVPIHIPTDR